jgi:hypothetical protein
VPSAPRESRLLAWPGRIVALTVAGPVIGVRSLWSSVKAALSASTTGEQPRIRRLGRGVYERAGGDRSSLRLPWGCERISLFPYVNL